MIKATVTDNQCELEMNGSFVDILANTCVLISAVYESVMENNKAAAEAFRQLLQEETADPDSPLWNEEVPQKKDVRVGMVDMAGCKNREQAAGLVVEALQNMGLPPEALQQAKDKIMQDAALGGFEA